MSDQPPDDLRYCNCADPENCREPLEGYVCKPKPAPPAVPVSSPSCVWKDLEGGRGLMATGCTDDIDAAWEQFCMPEIRHWKFCPYCGKAISLPIVSEAK